MTAGLTPLDPEQLVNVSVEGLRNMSVNELYGLGHRLGIDMDNVSVERGKLLTKLLESTFEN